MSLIREQRFTFEVKWYDQQADVVRDYRLFYFPVTSAVEMFDCKNQRPFLKRQQVPQVQLDDFFQGANVTIMSRVLQVMDYGDVHTRNHFENQRQRTFTAIKPDGYMNMGKVIDQIYQQGFKINRLKMSRFNQNTVAEFYAEHKGREYFQGLSESMMADVTIGMELVKDNAITDMRKNIGPTDSNKARQEAPGSIRAMFGTDGRRNTIHASDSLNSYKRENAFWFGDGVEAAKRPMQTTAVLNNCSLCLIKPHIVTGGQLGQVIDAILQAGFEVSAMEVFNLGRPIIEEFMDVYKGVLPEYLPLIEHLSNGPMVALEVRQENAVAQFREFCGPHDPEIAKHLRPNSLRAKFGEDRVKNAVHCTDMPEDGVLEVRYFFEMLQKNV